MRFWEKKIKDSRTEVGIVNTDAYTVALNMHISSDGRTRV